MGRFTFRFEAILRLRHNERDAARKYVAEAQAALDIMDQRIADVEQQRHELRGQVGGSLVGRVTVDRLLNRGRYDLQLAADQQELKQQRGQIEVEVERRRQRLRIAEQECRKLERLREIRQAEHCTEQLRLEQSALDEMATLRAGRTTPVGAISLPPESDR